MTVINTLRFNNESGGMVADAQSSGQNRKYDIANKIHTYEKTGSSVLAGGSGVSDWLYETAINLKDSILDKEFSTKRVAEEISNRLIGIKRKVIDKKLQSEFGFGETEYMAGKKFDNTPIGQHILGPAGEVYTGKTQDLQEVFGNGFLVLGKDNEGVNLYTVVMGQTPTLSARPYGSMGSGADESDKVLLSFVKNQKNQRNIDPINGMEALIRATNASIDINQGVGGIPSISFISNGKIKSLDKNESTLATEIVRAREGGFLNQTLTSESLSQLLQQGINYREVKEEVFDKNKKAQEIADFLRGYR